MKEQILVIRLLTGEEILGTVSKTEEGFKVEKPMAVQISQGNKAGDINLHLIPYLAFAKKNEIEFSKAVIAAVYEPVEELENKYRQVFGSGLILPKML